MQVVCRLRSKYCGFVGLAFVKWFMFGFDLVV